MKDTWSLDKLYLGYDDPQFNADLEALKADIETMKEMTSSLSHDNELNTLKAIVAIQEAAKTKIMKLYSFIELKQATNDEINVEEVEEYSSDVPVHII